MAVDLLNLRTKMVDTQIRTADITSLSIIETFLTVPREEFVPTLYRSLAYSGEAILLTPASDESHARYLMQPSALAKLIQLAAIKPDDVILDIGTGTGYSAAILSRLAHSVIAVESNTFLAEQANTKLTELGYDNVVVVTAPLVEGYSAKSPYNAIILQGAIDFIPDTLLTQMKNGGRLVAVEGEGNSGIVRLYSKENDIVAARRISNLALKPLPGFIRELQFKF